MLGPVGILVTKSDPVEKLFFIETEYVVSVPTYPAHNDFLETMDL
jgi:hypothetical protein